MISLKTNTNPKIKETRFSNCKIILVLFVEKDSIPGPPDSSHSLFVEKNTPTQPSKWAYYKSQAKKKFDVYPSAYANAWAAKKYKAAGGGWKKG